MSHRAYLASNKIRTNEKRDGSVNGHDVHQLDDCPHSMPVFEMGMSEPDSKWYYNECNNIGQISQSIRLQGSHSIVKAKVIR